MSSIEEAIEALKAGGFVVLEDHPERENEADVLLAAEHATGERINFIAAEVRGLIAVAVAQETLQRLEIPLIQPRYALPHAPRFAEPVDAVEGTTTGASAFDRALTVRLLADPGARPEDFSRPGHIFPLAAAPGGLAARRGHTEGAVALARMAGLEPVVVICELMNAEGHMARGDEVRQFARRHGMPLISVEELAQRTR
ncbi:MAG: 3,4-dihydroxy-2-butanone-4-phosphate synthase [Armatimonadota bacterium]|nr:3,4-dihydroxy-2-butanone-4-phosphate synthase [Armatimonadota bacterium]